MLQKRGQGQSWSLDIILALVIFLLIIGIFYAILGNNKQGKSEFLQQDANVIANNLDRSTGISTPLSIIDQGNIDSNSLSALYAYDYKSLKNQFGLKGDFCIYMVDQYNNVIVVNTSSGYMLGYGNSNYSINGQPCGTVLPP